MIVYPAVDIRGGKCVRLRKGDPKCQTDFGDPLEAAMRWKEEGAQWLHVVDLDGAFNGRSGNGDVIAEIVRRTGLPVELGGGIRTKQAIESSLEELQVARIVLGTVAVEFPELVKWAVNRYGNRVAVGIDARNGKAAVQGWVRETGDDPLSLAVRLHALGVETFIYTNIGRDGMLEGPDLSGTQMLVDRTGAQIIGSGGIGSLRDVEEMRRTGAQGCIIGRALFDGAFTLEEAIRAAGGPVC